jgi:hypothetical protein
MAHGDWYGRNRRRPRDHRSLALLFKLEKWPNLIDTISVLCDTGALGPDVIYKMWGIEIATTWDVWKDPVDVIRQYDRNEDTYLPFETLAKEMQRRMDAAADAKKRAARYERGP